MDHTSITSSPTFCPAPWTSLNIDQAGHTSPCFHCLEMIGNNKTQTIQEIIHGPLVSSMKESMARGEWHPGCSWCKRLEDTTGTSGRTVREVSKETAEQINKDINFFKLEHLVINWSNLCNLACVYCNNETSTAWQSINKIPINHIKNQHEDLVELVKTQGSNLQGLSLGGGEPLLQKGLVDFLKCLNPDNVRVMVTTNLSVDITSNPVYQELKTWPKVDWMISFDNADKDKFEYVRHGASWSQFVKNINQMKIDSQKIIAHPAYSIYCAWDLLQYYDFCSNEDLNIFWCELNDPSVLDIRRHSLPVRQRAIEEIDKVVNKYKHNSKLNTEALERYKLTLENPNYIDNNNFTSQRVFKWTGIIENKLAKTKKFQDLWPELAKAIVC